MEVELRLPGLREKTEYSTSEDKAKSPITTTVIACSLGLSMNLLDRFNHFTRLVPRIFKTLTFISHCLE